MTVQSEQRSRPSAILTRRNEISLGTAIRLDRISWGAKYSPKVRKPYTITKQREKWTEEEHNKFLEALKLYGRAWRRIEEYVGTKTTVQIRSHAQKFFSKVVRDSSGGSMDIIDIPPPRPKRKPIHPYPRKPMNPLINTEVSNEDRQRSLSPNSSVLEQEQQSPTSVISAVGSGSSTPSPTEELGFSSPPPLTDPVAVASVLNEKLELFPNLCERRKDEAKEASACAQSFKLFGKMLLFSDAEDSASNFEDMNVEKPREMFPWLTLSSKNPTRASSHHGSPELGRVEDGEVLNNRHWDGHETQLRDKESNLDLGLNARSKKRGFLFGSRVSLKSHEGCTKGFVPYKRLK